MRVVNQKLNIFLECHNLCVCVVTERCYSVLRLCMWSNDLSSVLALLCFYMNIIHQLSYLRRRGEIHYHCQYSNGLGEDAEKSKWTDVLIQSQLDHSIYVGIVHYNSQ